jgi:hypothetical protein
LPEPADGRPPFSAIINAARKVVFSRTLKTAVWANTTIASGDTTDEFAEDDTILLLVALS